MSSYNTDLDNLIYFTKAKLAVLEELKAMGEQKSPQKVVSQAPAKKVVSRGGTRAYKRKPIVTPPNASTVVRSITEYMKRNDLSGQEFADLVGCSYQAVRLWIKGICQPHNKFLDSIDRVIKGEG